MKIVNFADSLSVVNQYMAEIRDCARQTDRLRFRRNIERIGMLMAYEISKDMDYSVKTVTTPLGQAQCATADDEVVLATVMRAGLPFHQGFLEVFDHADNAFVSAYRYYVDESHTEVGVHVEYLASPSLKDKTLIMVDPMLATGVSLEAALRGMERLGKPKRMVLACVIASQQGVDHVSQLYAGREDVELWCGAIDPSLNERSYIVPGLGDAGDLAFGGKL